MTRRKDAPPNPLDGHADLLDELFTTPDSGNGFDFSNVEWPSFARLCAAVTGMGGMVTVYRRGIGGPVIVSARLGERRDQWEFDNEEQWVAILPAISDRYFTVYGRWLARQRATLAAAKEEAKPVPDKPPH